MNIIGGFHATSVRTWTTHIVNFIYLFFANNVMRIPHESRKNDNFFCVEFTLAHDKLSLVGGLARVLNEGPMCRSRMYFDCSPSVYLTVGSNESHNGRLSGSRFCRQSVQLS